MNSSLISAGQAFPARDAGRCCGGAAAADAASDSHRPIPAVDADASVVAGDMDHDALVLLAELTGTNQEIARYVGRVLDEDRGLTEFTTPLLDVELKLAERLIAAGQALRAHAHRRGRVQMTPANLHVHSRSPDVGLSEVERRDPL